jgi:hypothetical protein
MYLMVKRIQSNSRGRTALRSKSGKDGKAAADSKPADGGAGKAEGAG